MNPSGAERSRQLITAGVGALLLIVMGGVLIAGFRLATQMTANIGAMQTASTLQSYPNMIAQQLTSLRDRLEGRAYAGQALTDLKTTTERFDGDLKQLATGDFGKAPQIGRAILLWHQYGPVIDPVVGFHDQPYVESDEAGSSFSKAGSFSRARTPSACRRCCPTLPRSCRCRHRRRPASCGCCSRSACWRR
jgi:hypothetical protein